MSESQDLKASSQVKEGEHTTKDVASLPISHLRLGARARNCLAEENVVLIGDLVRKNESELLRIPNLGRLTLREIKAALGEWGLSPGMSATEISSASKDPRASDAAPETIARSGTPTVSKVQSIDIDFDVYQVIVANQSGFDETPNAVLRRLLGLEAAAASATEPQQRPVVSDPPEQRVPVAATSSGHPSAGSEADKARA